MFNTKERRERALGVRLFLKAYRSSSPKAAILRHPNKPGQHGGMRRRPPSEYGIQLAEKQKFKFMYGLREAQMRKNFVIASKSKASTGATFMALLERRLDNVVYRLGLLPSRSVGRQVINHGHIFVNGRRVSSPSFLVKAGDKVTIREQSKVHPIFKTLKETLDKYQTPTWLTVDPVTFVGTVKSLPRDLDAPFDISLVVDYYSKIVK